MDRLHRYELTTEWVGDNRNVRTYNRGHTILVKDKPPLHLTSDNAVVGDKSKLNPEDLLLSAVSSCHMLSYLYVCSLEGIVVTAYQDHASGTMIEQGKGGGHFTEIVLNPSVMVEDQTMIARAIELHHQAHEICYIANSLNFEIICRPICQSSGRTDET